MISTNIRGSAVVLGVTAAIAAAIVPSRAEDGSSVYAALFQSLRHQERVAPREPRMVSLPSRPLYSPYLLDHRFTGRPRTVREKKRGFKKIETAKPDKAEKPKTKIPSNPHLALMTDPTLRAGDIVMFPDGPRVFQGQPGDRHALSDFVPFAKAKGLTNADRKYLTALRSGVNDAWVVEASGATTLAQNARDVETTGSVSKKRIRP